jgi:hypothetical protein
MDMAMAAAEPQSKGRRAWRWLTYWHDEAVCALCIGLPILNLLILAGASIVIPMRFIRPPSVPVAALGWKVPLVHKTTIVDWRVHVFCDIALIVLAYLLTLWATQTRRAPGDSLKPQRWIAWWPAIVAVLAIVLVCIWNAVRPPDGNIFGDYNLLAIAWYVLVGWGMWVVIDAYRLRRPGAGRFAAIAGLGFAAVALASIVKAKNSPEELMAVGMHVCEGIWITLISTWGLMFVCWVIAAIMAIAVVMRCKGTALQSIGTAAFSLGASICFFFVFTNIAWGALIVVAEKLDLAPNDVYFQSSPAMQRLRTTMDSIPIFSDSSTSKGPLMEIQPIPYADIAVRESGVYAFALVAGLTLLALLFAAAGLAPAVWSDLFPPDDPNETSERAGRWLNSGFNVALKAAGIVLVIAAFLIVPVSLLGPFLWHHALDFLHVQAGSPVRQIQPFDLYIRIVTVVATTTLTLLLTGQIDSIARSVGPVLTAVLDIDAYLRLHPKSSNPRARIFARYASLLRHIATATDSAGQWRYNEIVIVAHSQGTVITSDLLRFLKIFHDPQLKRLSDNATLIRLLTVGCPLRQLYNWRFHNLYKWVSEPADTQMNTLLGVGKWTNAYRTGDYIGRWLWRPYESPDLLKPEVPPGKPNWDWSAQPPILDPDRHTGDQSEYCIGSGGHVRYFDRTAPAVTFLLDRLIADP